MVGVGRVSNSAFLADIFSLNRFFNKFSFVLLLIGFATSAYGAPSVVVESPASGSAGSPVFYEAFATSFQCAKGVSSMRIYKAPNVIAYTTKGQHIEAFINLAPGTYHTVVQAFDNCGGVGKTAVDVSVSAATGVSVFLPALPYSTPLHIAASAQNAGCAAGINAMRIYIADGVTPYTVNSNQLNTYLDLAEGQYKLTVQAWDNCGHVFKSQFNRNVLALGSGHAYAIHKTGSTSTLYEFNIAAGGILKNPNGSNALPEYPVGAGANSVTTDPGGWFVYVSTPTKIIGYQISELNGALTPMPGSPFPLNGKANGIAPTINVDRSGRFLYATYQSDTIASYRIERSTGALSSTGFVNAIPSFRATLDMTGQYVYSVGQNNGIHLAGFKINPNTGNLTAVPGSPYTVPGEISDPSAAAAGKYLYVAGALNNGGGEIFGYGIDYSTGALTSLPASPFSASSPNFGIFNLYPDVFGRNLWTFQQQEASSVNGIQSFVINQDTGDLAASPWFLVPPFHIAGFVEDNNGVYVYTSEWVDDEQASDGVSAGVSGWPIRENGDLTTQTQFKTKTVPNSISIGDIAVARENPM